MSDVIITLSCPDQPGIVRAVSGFVADQGCTITESHQFIDGESSRLYMRLAFQAVHGATPGIDPLSSDFAEVAQEFLMTWKITDATRRARLIIMVSKFGHCLNDLLYRVKVGQLNAEIAAVVSNHRDLEQLATAAGVPFVHVPVTAATKPEAEAELLRLVDALDVDLVVLARYMQILSAGLCAKLEGRAINIHHSMLPSFKGAKPYRQAYQRGVKLVGATAHYVTSDLDEGPIIEQEVQRVDHAMDAAGVTALGRDTESLALARAVQWHLENRVMLDGRRTVVFR
ncbi:formyltetrahydrofolate deformylase [Catenulispora sp. NL8]|uniref:Formyltetrahydrofolate deformylase n=1 Tax=Catenulispora pinistramenti TaxID=2705254 RepID=A0ABS5KMQ5_9ACTN|nr:formyltetrahydrofolate deformylase [Catenulispora pinistramenti]MBS2547307.1 formyltetrahydrofolate deformylase [Catenulispora pinistramenti]